MSIFEGGHLLDTCTWENMVSSLAFIAKKSNSITGYRDSKIYAYLSQMCMSIILGCNVEVSCPCPYKSTLTLQEENSYLKLNFGIVKFAKFKFLSS